MNKTISAGIAAGLMAAGLHFFGGTETSPPVAQPTAGHEQPAWLLPVEAAREKAGDAGRPLLLVSLNGNLDGTC